MNKYIKLLFVLPLLFITSISAKEIDMQGQSFSRGELYLSGDIYKNVKLNPYNNDYIAIFASFDHASLFYNAQSNDSNVFNSFVVETSRYNAFDVEDGSTTNFKIPKIFNKKVLWRYTQDEINMFSAEFIMPNYQIECEKDTLGYNDVSKCYLYIYNTTYKEYINDSNYIPHSPTYYVFINHSFDLDSDDYYIDNVQTTNGKFEYNNGKVNGSLYDPNNEIVSRQYNDVDLEEIFMNYYKGMIEKTDSSCMVTFATVHAKSPRIGLTRWGDESECYITEIIDRIKILSFDIRPKTNETKDGIISISNVNVGVPEDDTFTKYKNISAEPESNTIPIIGEVKGVEENPDTGLFNYLLLIIPVVLLGLGFYSLRKVNVFKKI